MSSSMKKMMMMNLILQMQGEEENCNSQPPQKQESESGGIGGRIMNSINAIGSGIGMIIGGNSLGEMARGLHSVAEGFVIGTGSDPWFGPIDEAIIHPLLWEPLSMITGEDVSAHPEGLSNVEGRPNEGVGSSYKGGLLI